MTQLRRFAWFGAFVLLGTITLTAWVVASAYGNDPASNTASAVGLLSGGGLIVAVAFYAYRSSKAPAANTPPIDLNKAVRNSRPVAFLTGGRTNEELIADLGRVVRFLFFVAAAGAILVGVKSADWSAFDTPFAQMTLNMLVGSLGKLGLAASAPLLWYRWAFASGERAYEAWGYLGLVAVTAALLFWLIQT
jgi:hypothetical protein